MKKLADISAFEGLQGQANRSMGAVSELAVFNGEFTNETLVEARRVNPDTERQNIDDVAQCLVRVMAKRSDLSKFSFRDLYSTLEDVSWDVADRMFDLVRPKGFRSISSYADKLLSLTLAYIADSDVYDRPKKQEGTYEEVS